MKFTWSRTGGYEVSSKGDKRFSALFARMPDGRTIEDWYQCDVKGYPTWKEGKGKPPRTPMARSAQWDMYLSLWKEWAANHNDLMEELHSKAISHGCLLSDRFANSDINQAKALAQILNERTVMPQLTYVGIGSRDTPTEVLDNMKVVAAELATRGW